MAGYKWKYAQKLIPYPQYNYLVAVCLKMIIKNLKQRVDVKKQFCHNDCDLHIMVFSEEVRKKYEVHLLCVADESPETIKIAEDVMERMDLVKTQPQLNEMLDIDEEGFPKERDTLIKIKKDDRGSD